MRKGEWIFSLLVSIFLVTLFFHKVFSGLVPLPADLIVGGYYPWLDYKWGYNTIAPVKNNLLSDAVSINYPLRLSGVQLIKKGELPLWDWSSLAGHPLFFSIESGLLFPTIIFYFFFLAPTAWTLQVMFIPLLSLIFTYAFLRELKLGQLPSIFGSIAYSFGGFIIIWLEWNCQSLPAAFLPLLLLLTNKLIKTQKLVWGILLSLAVTLQIFAGYIQVVQFSLVAVVLWLLVFRASKTSIIKIGCFIFLGLSLSSVLLIPNLELFQLSQRKVALLNQTDAFLPYQYLAGLLAPDLFGNPSTKNFWGEGNYTNMVLYTGIIAFILALAGMMLNFFKKPIQFAAILGGLTLLIMLPNPVSISLYKLGAWGGSSVDVNRAAFLVNLSLALLSAFGLQYLTKKDSKYYLKSALVVALLLVALGTLALINTHLTSLPNLSLLALKEPNIWIRNLILPLLLTISAAGIFLLILRSKIKLELAQFILITLLIFDLFRFGLKFNSFSKPDFLFPSTPLLEYLKKIDQSRISSDTLDILPPNTWNIYGLSSAGGYSSMYPSNIAKLIAVVNSKNTQALPQDTQAVLSSTDPKLLAELGTGYLLTPKRNDKGVIDSNGQIDKNIDNFSYQKVFEDKSVVVLKDLQSLPLVYLTSKVTQKSNEQILSSMLDPGFNPNQESLTDDFSLDKGLSVPDKSDISFQKIANNHLKISTNSPSGGMLVILNNYYPGWEARVDSKPVKIHRTNYAFQGVVVPSGVHQVDLTYLPKSLIYGFLVSVLSLLTLSLIGYFSIKNPA